MRFNGWCGRVVGPALAMFLITGTGFCAEVERIFRPERHSRGDTNYRPLQEIDRADWIWHPGVKEGRVPGKGTVLRFRCRFAGDGTPFEIDVSGDESFVLLLDGREIARGPHRGTVDHWLYQSYRLCPAAGEHVLEAVVSRFGRPVVPTATNSNGGGFVLKAGGAYDGLLTTGKAAWEVGEVAGTTPDGAAEEGRVFGCGEQFVVRGTDWLHALPSRWERAALVRAGIHQPLGWGVSREGWALYPTPLPDQISTRRSVGRVVAAYEGPAVSNRVWRTEDAANPFVRDFAELVAGRSVRVPAGKRVEALVDLDDYWCAYPELCVSGGTGAVVRWEWIESLRIPDGSELGGEKGDRNAFVGKVYWGPLSDTFVSDGRPDARFGVPWWRSGRWCRLVVETADEPAVLSEMRLRESRYPLEAESSFACDSETLVAVNRLCARGVQMCGHDIAMDCPRYEQQMYPGDAFMFFRSMSACTADDRLLRRAVDIFDYGRRQDGSLPMHWPACLTQNSSTWTLFWTYLVADAVRRNENADWAKARLPGFRHTLFGFESYENAEGLLENPPGWNFLDWVPSWNQGTPPAAGTGMGYGCSGIMNLLYLLALQNAVVVESAVGDPLLAERWRRKSEALRSAVRRTFLDPSRHLFADTADRSAFSVHSQVLGIVTQAFEEPERMPALEAALTDRSLVACAPYFEHFVFAAAFSLDRADVFFDRLATWENYVRIGLRAPLESPTFPRSDCHGFAAFPLYHCHHDIAGVRPAAPFFAKVRVEPHPGKLSFVRARTPHPRGFVETDLGFSPDGKVRGSVCLPEGIDGEFVWKGVSQPLKSGRNEILGGSGR